jgi:hypothetical protein
MAGFLESIKIRDGPLTILTVRIGVAVPNGFGTT